ncbi:MAG TPA: diguanylate cyclase [Arenimonas sp.]|nr:diguanylate cyclase [Arenimonas sp.]
MPAPAPHGLSNTRHRVLAMLGLVLLLYVALTVAALRGVVFPAFERVELQDAMRHLERIEHALDARREHLASFCRDWAFWDDSYAFAAMPDDTYVEANLTEDATANTPTDLIAVFNAQGDPVHIGIYRALSPFRGAVHELAGSDGALYRHAVAPLLGSDPDSENGAQALIDFRGQPVLAIGYPILRSDRTGPPGGVFLMAKLIDEAELQTLQAQTLVPFTLTPGRAVAEMPDSEHPFTLASGSSGWIEQRDAERLTLMLRLPAADGAAFDIATRYDRQMSREGVATLGYALLLSTLGFTALVGLLYFGLLAPSFLRPLSAMSKALAKIERERDLGASLPVQGAPELQALARTLNGLMRQVEADREEISLLSLTDELTRLPNRRRFEQVLVQEWSSALRQKQSIAVLLCDVDHFKPYNDHYGHPAGDDCLRRIAGCIQRALMRRTDVAARYGGEEFIVILPDTDTHGALTSAQRIVNAVRELGLPHSASPVAEVVTVSIGFYAATPSPERDPAEWVSLADSALYRAKAGGRNRVEQAVAANGRAG